MDEMKEEVFHIINSLEKLYDLKIDIEIDDEVPAAIINEEAESHLNQAIIEELGKENIQARLQTSGADDFHFYTLLRPHLKATMLALGADVKPGLHDRSEEHTSELQSRGHLVCRLLLEKKNNIKSNIGHH